MADYPKPLDPNSGWGYCYHQELMKALDENWHQMVFDKFAEFGLLDLLIEPIDNGDGTYTWSTNEDTFHRSSDC